MKWITALDLEQWADRLGARDAFPALVGDLIRASATKIDAFRFPSGDKGQVRGFDGSLEAEAAPPFVPGGSSIWEFGVNANAPAKAERDYTKRVSETPLAERLKKTFVFVSPRTWNNPNKKLDDWVKEKIDLKDWASVKYIDGVALEHWLDEHPAVAARYSRFELRNNPPTGARSTDEFWEQYAARFKPSLTEDVLLCERQEQAEGLLQKLAQPSGDVRLVADSPDEVIAFAVAAIRKAKPEVRFFLEARTLIVDQEQTVSLLTRKAGLIFLPRGSAREQAGVFTSLGPTLIAIGGDQPNRNYEVLARPSTTSLGKAIQTMGFADDKAYELACSCGRSVTILSRLIPGGAAARPEWIEQGSVLLPALLAGGWDTTFPQDKEILSDLAGGRDYAEFETELRPLTRIQDPPIDRVGDVWKMRAPVDAIAHLGHLIGEDQLSLLKEAASKVFSRVEEPPNPDELFQFAPKPPEGYSVWLRDGLATTLLQIATIHGPARIMVPGSTPQAYVNDLIGALPGLADNHRLLASLKNELPLLAEAAPDPLLRSLERLLEGDGAKIRPIFSESERVLAPSSPHTGLLWALEILAWDPTLLRRVSLILAQLAAIDPGGRLINRPINSLRQIFLSWMPNTNASVNQRLAVLDYITSRVPDVGWDLMIKLLPKAHDTSSPSQKPRFREAGASDRETLTYGVVWESQRGIVSRALDLAGANPDRWVIIIKHLRNFEPAQRARALELINEYLGRSSEGAHRKVWSALRDEVNRNRAFADAEWSLPADELANFEAIVRQHEPKNPIDPISWLFDDWAPNVSGKRDNRLETADKARREAMEGLLAAAGIDGVLELAKRAKLTQFVATAFAEVSDDVGDYETLILRTLGVSNALDFFAEIISSAAFRRFGIAWSTRLKELAARENWPVNKLASLLLRWQDNRETWAIVAGFGREIEDYYWRNKYPFMPEGDVNDLVFAAERYVSAERASTAIEALHLRIGELPVSVVFDLLDALIPEINSGTTPVHDMLSYYVENIFEMLEKKGDVRAEDVARREYAYLPLLEHRDKSLTLHRLMAKSPEFYVSVICDVFKAASGEAHDLTDADRSRANAGYGLLRSFKVLPGERDGSVDVAVLREWVGGVRQRAAEADRARVADQYIGHILAHAPTDKGDQNWPDVSVRTVLEELDSDDVENGLLIECLNMRGAFFKAVFEGGVQERQFAEQYRNWAKNENMWPRTSATLERIAEAYDHQAEHADIHAQQDKMRF